MVIKMVGIGLYLKDSVKAVELYKAAFGLELGYNVLNDDGTFFHSELNTKSGEPVVAVVEAVQRAGGYNPVQLGFTFSQRSELERAFKLLGTDGEVLMDICELPWSPCAAEVKDAFGVRWYLTLDQHRPDDDFTPNDCK